MEIRKLPRLLCAVVLMAAAGALTSCSESEQVVADDAETLKQNELRAIAQQYIQGTVHPTYAQLADSTDCLFQALHAMKVKLQTQPDALTDADVQEACHIFLQARSNYETSEAFLFGAATDFGIDPHIDTWPLDLQGLAVALTNSVQTAAMDAYEEGHNGEVNHYTGDAYASNKLGPELLGFHGIEFILFRHGQPRSADALRGTDRYEGTTLEGLYAVSGLNELIFATAVAGDLRNKCWQMEVAWNEQAPEAHRAKVEDDMEWPTKVGGSNLSYGQNFLMAGQAGSNYASLRKAMEAILSAGCATIADEVGNTKMGKPFTGEDKNYIESPYSEQSLTDFFDNILGIENAYLGGRPTHRQQEHSLHAYLADHNAVLDARIVAAITQAKAAIAACPKPFVQHYNHPAVQQAIDACNELDQALVEAANWILKN